MKETDSKNNLDAHIKETLVMAGIAFLAVLSIPLAGARAVSAEPTSVVYLPFAGKPPDMLVAGHLLITEVMNYPHINTGSIEWIEIFNAGRETVDLRHYKIGDEEQLGGSEGMLQFPRGASLEPGGLLVLAEDAVVFQEIYGFAPDYEFKDSGSPVPDMLKYAAWSGGNLSMVNSGDEVLLLDRYDRLVDAVSWGSSNWAFDPDVGVVSAGQTIERFPGYLDSDSAGDWRRQIGPTPGRLNTESFPPPTPAPSPTPVPSIGGVLISEVLFDPLGAEPAAEWFEIYNPTGQPVDLSGHKIGDEETQGGSEGMFRFPPGTVISAGGRLTIAVSAEAFRDGYGFLPDFETAGTSNAVADMEKYAPWGAGGISLGNAGDELVLLDSGDAVVDAVSWGSSTWAFSPSVSRPAAAGMSIERHPPDLDTDAAGDWRASAQPSPGR